MMMDKGQIDNYVLQSRLGSGAFAQVFRAVHKTTGNVVAIKMIDVYRLTERNSKLKENLNYEIKILKTVSHENIVTLYDVLEPPPPSDSYIYMVMECCEGGDFSKYIRKHKKLTEDKAIYFMRQLATGLKFLRQRDIIHRDLKPQNLLLSDSSDMPILKIADFGFARFIDVQSLSDTFCGSPLYMAPEILHRKNYTVKADLWSVGVILYEMLVGEPPYNCSTVVDLLHQLETSRVRIPSSVAISRECQDLLYSLLQTNEMNRISWDDFFSHPWLGFSQSIPHSLPNNYPPYKAMSAPSYTSSPPQSDNFPYLFNNNNNSNNTSNNSTSSQKTIVSPTSSDRVFMKSKSFSDNINNIRNNGSGGDFEKDCVILDDEEVINSIERIGKRAVAIAELGDLRQFEPSECLPLYIKALMLIKPKLQISTNSQSFGSPNLIRFNGIMERLKEIYRDYLTKSIKCYTNRTDLNSTFIPNKFIYETALEMGRNGGVEEMYKEYPKSLQCYTDGLLLLEYLLSIAVEKEDIDIIHKFPLTKGSRQLQRA
eukprot:gene12793-15012_t